MTDVAALLRGTVLDGLPVEEDVGGALVVQDIDSGLILPSWQAARSLVPETGRWPVMIVPEEIHGDPSPEEVATLETAATTMDPWSVFHPPVADRHDYDAALGDPVLAAHVTTMLGDFTGTRQWFVPNAVHLALLPTPRPWLAPGWLRYYGAGDPTRWTALTAALWQWNQRYGAELVAWWGTMLQFVVSRPPAPGDEAWELAGQLSAVGGSL
ncbi:DUF4253 domain-containing protein [Actinoplanes sp. LDG1-06]|uniref:DUF4253 domain-containing protein n=1 Tax=Paractinoplanes ovalisporus TaxID=2810368 RepID=A0ABS2A380_9ACTN|nr:DUF4253 domain-containing protein [Actinoplanes ovalisporus]MBM2614293.1 DUF4253 domain-containing protein [Actinoplanes ovalisporus]